MADLPARTKPTITDCLIACMTAYGLGDKGADAALDQSGSLPFSARAWRWFGGRRNKMPDQSRAVGINLLVWGDPGLSKTSCFNNACKVIPKNPYEIILSQSEAVDIGGIPRVQSSFFSKIGGQDEGVFTQKIPDAFFRTVSRDANGVIWADDLTNCDRSVQAALLGVALNRRVPDGKGGWIHLNHLPQMAAANHGDAHSLAPLLGPAANRWGHIIQGAADDGYLYWVDQTTITLAMTPVEQAALAAGKKLGRDFVPSQLHARIEALPNEWNERYARAFNMVSAYIKEVGPKKAIQEPAPTDFTHVEDYAWATYRTWELAARFMAVAEHYNMDDKRLLQGAVGLEAAGKFMDFRNRMLNMPSVDDVFNGNVDWSKLKASETTVLLQQAGSACGDDQQLDAVFTAINTVKGINEELVRPSEDILVQRAKGLIHNKPLTPSMIDKVKAQIPPRINPAALKGTVAQRRTMSKWLDPWSDTPPWGIEGPEILAA